MLGPSGSSHPRTPRTADEAVRPARADEGDHFRRTARSWAAIRALPRRVSAVRPAVALVQCVAALLLVPPTTAHAQLLNVTPFVTCIELIPGGFIAYFGYESFEPQPSSIFIGPDNFFVPAPGDRGQISLFFEGYTEKAFRVPYQTSSGPSLTWNLQGATAIASANTPQCPTLAPPLAASLSVVSGGNQTANVNAAFAQPMVISASVNGRPLRGLSLRATPPASGASATVAQNVVTTDANGRASFSFTANATVGSYNVTIAVGTSATPITTLLVPLRNQ